MRSDSGDCDLLVCQALIRVYESHFSFSFFLQGSRYRALICVTIRYIPPAAASATNKYVGNETTRSCSQVVGDEMSRMSAFILVFQWRRTAPQQVRYSVPAPTGDVVNNYDDEVFGSWMMVISSCILFSRAT